MCTHSYVTNIVRFGVLHYRPSAIGWRCLSVVDWGYQTQCPVREYPKSHSSTLRGGGKCTFISQNSGNAVCSKSLLVCGRALSSTQTQLYWGWMLASLVPENCCLLFLLFSFIFTSFFNFTCSICCILLGSTLTDCFSLSGNNMLHVIQRISKLEHHNNELQKLPVFSNAYFFNHNGCHFLEAIKIFLSFVFIPYQNTSSLTKER